MDIAFGHTNMDLDCLGSLILIKKLFPSYRLIRSNRIHPAAENLYNLYRGCFDFMGAREIAGEHIDNIIIVDTCMASRVKEYFEHIKNSNPAIQVFDHHQIDKCDILNAQVDGGVYGANTSFLCKMAMKQKLHLESEEATIALTGIYADTGRLIYENVRQADLEVAAWLLGEGASLKLVKSFLETVKEDEQVAVLNQIMPLLKTRSIQGHVILSTYLELDENVAGLAAIVDKVMEIESPDAYFAFFAIPKTKTVLLIARSQKTQIDLHEIMSAYGGGGHQAAASAKILNRNGAEFEEEFFVLLDKTLAPAVRARDIMTSNVYTIHESTSLLDASLFLERVDFTGVPVVNKDGDVAGFISLRDIMKGRKAEAMKAPVSAYMSKPIISAGPAVTMREVERIFFKYRIGHLPIVGDNKLLGIVSRWDYLEYRKTQGT